MAPYACRPGLGEPRPERPPAHHASSSEIDMISFRLLRPFRLLAALAPGAALVALCGCESTPTSPPTPLPPLSRVVISDDGDTTVTADTLAMGDAVAFTAAVYDTGNAVVITSVSWSSSNSGVMSVAGNGTVTARGEGFAWLFASVSDKSDSVRILVLPAARGWVQQVSNSSRRLNGIYMQPDGRSGCVVGDGGEILTTGDAGETWVRRASNTSFNLQAVWFMTASKGFAVGNAGTILRTTNGGLNWTLVTSNASENLRDVCFAHPDTGWAVGTSGAILRTFNAGASWQKQNPTAFALNGVAFSDTRNGWAVGDNGTIVGTVDRGLNWTVVTPSVTGQALRAVWARSLFGNWSTGAQGVTPRTIDNAGAVEWELRNAGAANDLDGVFFVTDYTGFACGTNGTGIVLRTDDTGVTWTPQAVPNGTPLNDVFFVDEMRGWVVGDNGRILHTGSAGRP